MTIASLGRVSIPKPRAINMQSMAQQLMQSPVGLGGPTNMTNPLTDIQNSKAALISGLQARYKTDPSALLNLIAKQQVGWKPKVSLPAAQYTITPGKAPTGGPVHLAGNVDSWIAQAYKILGIPLTSKALADERYLINHESGGNPNAVNKWDINYKRGTPSIGIEQVIMPTFLSNMLKGHGNIYNPIDNILSSLIYRKKRYKTYDIGAYKGGY